MFDSHVHLTDKKFDSDRHETIKRAVNAGVSGMLSIPGISPEEQQSFMCLLKDYEFIYGAVGVHPGELNEGNPEEMLAHVKENIGKNSKIVAIGEIGLDYYYPDSAPRELQKKIFVLQLHIAMENKLPVIIHCRDAWQDMAEILKQEAPVSGVMHCFSGSAEMMDQCIESGLYISIAGPVTFSNAAKTREIAGSAPIEKLLVETDCPYLAPQEMRGKRNEPAFLRYIVKKISEIRNIPVEEVAEITCKNTKRLFRL